MLPQPHSRCRSEKQEEQMQQDVASPALYESHLHSWVVEATLWAGLSTFLSVPLHRQHLTFAAASKTTEGNGPISLNRKIYLAVDF